MTPAVFWSARDWAEAIAALPTEGALPTRTVLVPREAVAHSLRRELVKAGHAQVLIGTRFVPTLAAAVAVLEEADLRFETGEEALRSARLLKLFADGLTLEHFPPTLLRERPGWDDAFARTIGDLESVGLRPEDLARDGDARLRDIAAVWSALDAQAGAAWTAPRVWLEAAQALERGAAWPFRGRTLATASAPTSAAEARFLRAVPGVVVTLHGARPVREQRQRPARASRRSSTRRPTRTTSRDARPRSRRFTDCARFVGAGLSSRPRGDPAQGRTTRRSCSRRPVPEWPAAVAPEFRERETGAAMPPVTRYVKSGDVHLAYQVVGEAALDIVFVHGWVSHVEYGWELPPLARFLNRLASFSRLILFDRRGTGMSDRVPDRELPTLEERMDDIRTVMDAAGSERAAIFGASEGGNMSVLFAATYPDRTLALVTFGIFAKRIWSPDYPWAPTPEQRQKDFEVVERDWHGDMDVSQYAPSADAALRAQIAAFFRRSASPGAALTLLRMNTEIDVRHVLPAVRVPTLVLHRTGDLDASVEEGRWIAGRIPGARFVELPGADHLPWVGDTDGVLDEVEEFLTGVRRGAEPDRVLATVLFTDIVGASATAAALGDRAWRDLLQAHHSTVRRELARFRGRELDTAGDGFLATFDGPARAVRCACAIRDAVAALGIQLRAGLHTGECEVMGDKLSGVAVHIGARVAAAAGPGEVWVSSTVKDLVAGSGLHFADRGLHVLKGIPGEWRLFGVGGTVAS